MSKTLQQLQSEASAAKAVYDTAAAALKTALDSIQGAQDAYDAADVAYRKAIGVGGKSYNEPNLHVACVAITHAKLQQAQDALRDAKLRTF